MPGRPPWSQPGTQGGGQTVAVNNRPTLANEDLSQSGTLSSGSQETVELFAPAGSVYQVINMLIYVPFPGTETSGSARVDVEPMGDSGSMLVGKSDHDGDRVEYKHSEWLNANSAQKPSDKTAQTMVLKQLVATESSPIRVKVENSLDVDLTGDRTIVFIAKEMSY